ncbi:MAG: DNA methylase [Acidobacteria bacterium RIFCSPLOWO2_02_FULL_64_15]|nr:MAG: DNA methylase [Acidobacteria bacterium RIFCSPLOWO2_02_FULL_64_15]
MAKSSKTKKVAGKVAEGYTHPDKTLPMRPEVGTQAQFRKKKPPVTYRYDSSLSPALEWDGQNAARELGDWLLSVVEKAAALPAPHVLPAPAEFTSSDGRVVIAVGSLQEAVDQLKRLSKPFLNWAGKAERLSFDVPTLPLFVHERLSTKAIVETLVGHKTDKQTDFWEMLGDPRHSIADQVLKAYEYPDKWVNRLILGDSLVVMNSLLHYERLGGQVQTIYIDPPYGVKFGSNFQPFVRKRDVSHGDDGDLTREPEMVKAYRDTWELGLHSYLTYMRDRLLLARELLTPSGSVFVQISDENVHCLRQVMDEVFGSENFAGQIVVQKTGGLGTSGLKAVADYLLWYAKDHDRVKYRQLFGSKRLGIGESTGARYDQLLSPDGKVVRPMTDEERSDPDGVPQGWRAFQLDNLTSGAFRENTTVNYKFQGEIFHPGLNACWKTTVEGLDRLAQVGRIQKAGRTLRYRRFLDDFPAVELTNVWDDVAGAADKLYVVQTSASVAARCVLMTTDPGDLVLDPTCGSGTTAYVAEQWGRRWITIDTSRVPLALARQRLLTATFNYYELKEPAHGPSGGFVYKRKQNNKGEEVGGIVPHVTLKSIANNEPPDEEVLVDRPEIDNKFVRVSGPLVVEATIPTPVDWEGDGIEDSGAESVESYGSFVERMIEVLRKSPVLHVGGGKTVELANIRPPAKSLSLSAEGMAINKVRLKPDITTARTTAAHTDEMQPVAFVFGPENGAVSEKLVHAALQEAQLKSYTHLYVIGFAIQPHARQLIDSSAHMGLVPATYVQATPDLMMGDLLKNMRSSQIFSVCGLPEIKIHHAKPAASGGAARYEVELIGLDTFDPTTMETNHRGGNDVPCWMLDADYNTLCFRASQVFFPRTAAWDGLKKALKADYDESVWDHLAGTRSAPFEAGDQKQIAVKVIDDRGNELLVVKAVG